MKVFPQTLAVLKNDLKRIMINACVIMLFVLAMSITANQKSRHELTPVLYTKAGHIQPALVCSR